MKQYLLLALLIPAFANAQMTNTGQLNNQTGGTISDFSQSFTNTSTATYTGSGGNFNHGGATFTNNGTYTATAGTDNFNAASGAQTIAGSTAPVFFKAKFDNGSTGVINITNGHGIIIEDELQFLNGITTTVRTDDEDGAILFNAGSSYTGTISDNRFVDGYVTKAGATNFIYPVGAGGDARTLRVSNIGATVSNSVAYVNANPNSSADGTGGPYSVANKQAAIKSIYQLGYWDWVNVSGTAGADIRLSLPDLTGFAFDAADVQLIGWKTSSSQWELIADGATGLTEGSTITGTIANVSQYSAFGIGKASNDVFVDAKVFLQGTYNAGTGVMGTSLNTLNILENNALAQPYNAAPFNYAGTESVSAGFFAANNTIVDWVLVELRDGTTPATVIATRAGFVKSNGDIVDINGTSNLGFHDIANGSYHIAVRHRNHITIRTSSTLAVSTPDQVLTYNFTTAQSKAYQNPSVTANTAMKEFTNGKFGMWGGNVNSNANSRYSGILNDKDALLNGALSGNRTTVLSNVYNKADLNMNGTVRYSGILNDKDFLLNTVLSGNRTAVITQH